jgi:methionine sulfoxide reductase heme-binding subunit
VKKIRRFNWLQIAVHITGWFPLALLIYYYLTDNLTINPIQDIEQRLGRIAVYFLVATLAVTPLYTVTGWRAMLPRRRAIGLYTFLYACLHILVFLALDYDFNFSQILPLLIGKLYLIAGVLSFSMLIPLAVTSFDYFKRRMGRKWKQLHWLIYPTGFIVILHYAWSLKGNIFTLKGNIIQPLIWGIVIALLMILRLPPLRRWISSLRQKIVSIH